MSDSDFLVYRTSASPNIERIVLEENNANAHVKWKNNIGTLNMLFLDKAKYISGADLSFLPDGKIYYQDQYNLYSVDVANGHSNMAYEKPYKPPITSSDVIDLAHPCGVTGKKIFAVRDILGKHRNFFIIDENNQKTTYVYASSSTAFCANSKAIIITEHFLGDGVAVANLDPYKRLWWSGEFLRKFYSVTTSNDTVFILYKKSGSLFVEAYVLDYDGPAAGLNTGKLLWRSQLGAFKSADESLYKAMKTNEAGTIQILKELFVTSYASFEENTGAVKGEVVSIDPNTGEINWRMSDITRIYMQSYDEALFYIVKKTDTSTIYGLDQKTGKEKLKISLTGWNAVQGLLSIQDKVFFAGSSQLKDDLRLYNTFTAVDKKTGQKVWTTTIDEQKAMPHYENGILYFGYKPDSFGKIYEGSIKQYEYSIDFYSKNDLKKNLLKTAFALDAETGKVLWKIKLEGGDESYVEKILVKDNMTFIKSSSGWLYAIEGGKPK